MWKWIYKPLSYSNEPIEEHCPTLLPDIIPCITNLAKAIDSGDLIRLLGDYDSDGLNSTNILQRCIKDIGGNVDAYIPERSEGYGANEFQVTLAYKEGVKLLVLIDNGSSAFNAIRKANELGINMIIIDHHNIPDQSKVTVSAFVNPKRADSIYPFKEVCATLLAWKVAHLLYDHYGFPEGYAHDRFLDLVAVGTIGDIMPIIGENRRIVIDGLKKANDDPSLQVRNLTKAMGVYDVDVKSVGFMICPALNSASRLGKASESYAMLISDDKKESKQMSYNLKSTNNERKSNVAKAIENMVIVNETFPVIYYHHDDIAEGIIGLVASHIVRKYKKPAMVSCRDSHGKIKGSARSFANFSLYNFVMGMPQEYFINRGGHDEALGFELQPSIHREFIDYFYTTSPIVDEYVIEYNDILGDIEQQIKMVDSLGPYGHGYEKPLFLCKGFAVQSKKIYENGKVYGKGVFQNKEYPFESELDLARKGDIIEGIIEFEKTKNDSIRFKFLDYVVEKV